MTPLAAATWHQHPAGIPDAMASMPLWIALTAASLVSSAALLLTAMEQGEPAG